MPASSTVDCLAGVDVVVPYISNIDAQIIAKVTFGLVLLFCVGLDGVDVDAATSAGVWVARVPRAAAPAMPSRSQSMRSC